MREGRLAPSAVPEGLASTMRLGLPLSCDPEAMPGGREYVRLVDWVTQGANLGSV